jgi:hypothetical protein
MLNLTGTFVISTLLHHHQPPIPTDWTAVAKQHRDVGGVPEAFRHIRQLGLHKLARHEFADVFTLTWMRFEPGSIGLDRILDGPMWGRSRSQNRLHSFFQLAHFKPT